MAGGFSLVCSHASAGSVHKLRSTPVMNSSRLRLRNRTSLRVKSMFGANEVMKEGITAGITVKVAAPVTIYHSPKNKEGLKLEGMQGTVLDVVTTYKGKELSANLPYKVQFMLPNPDTGKEQKLIAHLAGHEIEAV